MYFHFRDDGRPVRCTPHAPEPGETRQDVWESALDYLDASVSSV